MISNFFLIAILSGTTKYCSTPLTFVYWIPYVRAPAMLSPEKRVQRPEGCKGPKTGNNIPSD